MIGSKENSPLRPSRLLIISYLFPPAGGIAVQRSLSLAKYLSSRDYEVHVLKANTLGPVGDPELVHGIPDSVQIHEAFTPDIPFALRNRLWSLFAGSSKGKGDGKPGPPGKPGGRSPHGMAVRAVKRILSPEPEILWVPFALRKARRIIRKHSIDYVLVTVPPFSALVIGTQLKREFPSITLVSDFRDEWLGFYLKDFEFQNSDYTRRRAETIERESVHASNLVVAVNRSSRDVIRKRYPDQPESKFVTLTNGYDPDAFRAFRPRPNTSGQMLVTHIGTVYKTATPSFYLDALCRLPDAIREQIHTRFVGRISDGERMTLESRNAPVQVLGFMPQAAALKQMEETDYLLLTMTNEISVPGKLYEYIASGKPILAIAPAGSEVDQIMREAACGWVASPDDPEGIGRMLERAYEAWRSGIPLTTPNPEIARQYDRRNLVAEYGKLMRMARERQSVDANSAACATTKA